MLTVDYDRLGLRAGERLLDIGCGFGRHTYEGLRRGASVVSCDLGLAELHNVKAIYYSMSEASEIGPNLGWMAVNGDATRLPFDDETFDRVIASEVLEHITDDEAAYTELARVLRPGGTLAVTVPGYLAEKLCWKLSSDYPAPSSPGGHVRIYTEAQVRERLASAGLRPGAAHHAHGLHSPYWWLRCAVGLKDPVEKNWLVRRYHDVLCWDITKNPAPLRLLERALNPVIGKSLVVYATKPVDVSGHRQEGSVVGAHA